jgi:septal ring factor EnvC (AmiA/AmiB activator)
MSGERFGRILLAGLFAASLCSASAQAPRPAPETYTLDDLKRVEQQRDAALKRLKRLETLGRKAERESADIDNDLLVAAADSQRREEQAAAAEVRLADLSAQAAEARAKLTSDRAALDDLLAALMTFGSHRPPALATSPEDSATAIRAAILMGDAAPALSARARELAARIDTLNRLAEGVKREEATLAEADAALAARRDEIDALAQEKRLTRTSLAAETAALRAEAERLGHEAETLHDLLDSLAAAAPTAPSAKPPPAKPPPARPPAASTAPARPAGTATRPRPNDLAASAGASATRPVARKGATPVVPAVGRRLRRFGQKSNGVAASGLVLATRAGAQVVSPLDARVEYAGVFRSYGQMLILDVGGDILVVVSGLDALYPEAGQWVLAGEPIGRMADQKSPSPELYLEVRRNGQPIDPEKWLGRGA